MYQAIRSWLIAIASCRSFSRALIEKYRGGYVRYAIQRVCRWWVVLVEVVAFIFFSKSVQVGMVCAPFRVTDWYKDSFSHGVHAYLTNIRRQSTLIFCIKKKPPQMASFLGDDLSTFDKQILTCQRPLWQMVCWSGRTEQAATNPRLEKLNQ